MRAQTFINVITYVITPKEWMNGFVEVKLVEAPIKLNASSILKILENEVDVSKVLGVAITGSYARGEESRESDVDVLVVTENLDKKIKIGRYEIILTSEKVLKKQLENMGFPVLPMIIECNPVMNEKLFEEYKKEKPSKKALKWLIDTTKSSIKISKGQIALLKELGEKRVSDNVSYSLILRLRTVYILECLKKNKLWSKKEFLNLVKEVSGSLESYLGYVRVKTDKKVKKDLLVGEAESIVEYLDNKIKKLKNG